VTRAHLHLPLIDSSGALFPYASVTLNEADGSPFQSDVFVQPTGGNPILFPLFVDPGVIDVWLDVPSRVQIVAEVSDNVRIVLDGVDVLPYPPTILQAPAPLTVTGAANPVTQGVLMSAAPGEATFRVADPVGTHEHEGDSAGSVVLTGEEPRDFNPYQSWVGYHAGENAAPSSAASSALGDQADIYGASATLLGAGQVVAQTATGSPGDFATVLSSEAGTATGSSTVVGAANLTAQGQNMTVLGSVNGPSSGTSQPNNSTVIGPGNVIGAAGALKIGANHPTSNAGANHTTIGVANMAQQNGLPWAGTQTAIALGANKTLAGDPSDALSSTDWFGGSGPLAVGRNDTAFSPSLITLGNDVATQVALRVTGDSVIGGHRTYSTTSTALGFFGATGVTRPQVAIDPGDVSNTMLTSLLDYLSKVGLIYTAATPILTESGTYPDGTALEFAETGQALQWKLPPTSADYRSANAFTVASNKIVLNAAQAPFPTRGLSALYSCGRSNVSVQGRFGYNATGTNGITNSGFDADISSWTAVTANAVLVRDASRALYGSASLKITSQGTNTVARAYYRFPVTPGTQLNFSAYVRPASSIPSRISIEWKDSSFNPLSTTSQDATSPLNAWTRRNVGGTAPASAAYADLTVGYYDTVTVPNGAFINIDAAQVVTGTTLVQPFVENNGYTPEDQFTGLMVRNSMAQSISGGQPVAVVTGYLVGRKTVYTMSGNTIVNTVATLSTAPASGDLLQADCNGTSVTVRVNGTSVATFTDSTYNATVKHGYRVCSTTSVWGFKVFPFGF
jgi:hypothetical protein